MQSPTLQGRGAGYDDCAIHPDLKRSGFGLELVKLVKPRAGKPRGLSYEPAGGCLLDAFAGTELGPR